MSYDLLTFASIDDFMEYIDGQITQLRTKIDTLEKRYAVLKSKAERIRRLEEVLSKLIGSQVKSISEVDFLGIKVVVSARALDELTVVEETLAALRDTYTALTRVREAISRFAKEISGERGEINVIVQTLNGIPVKLLFKESETP